MAPRPWERASRPAAPTPAAYRARAAPGAKKDFLKPQAKAPARRHVPVRHTATASAASAGQHENIPGTRIKSIKGGTKVRVAHASGREFAINDVQGVRQHLEKLERTGQAAPVQKQQKVTGQIVAKTKGNTMAGKFASNVKVKVQQFQQRAAGGTLKFQLPTQVAIRSHQISQSGNKFKPAAKVASNLGRALAPKVQLSGTKFKPTAKVAATFVKKHILKPMSLSAYQQKNTATAWAVKANGNGERPAVKIQKEGRELVHNTYFTGKVVFNGNAHAWVLPLKPSIPAKVLPKLQKMNDDYRKSNKADNNWSSSWRPFAGGCKENVVYVAHSDIQENGLTLKDGASIRFKLYTDAKGVGGCEVISAR